MIITQIVGFACLAFLMADMAQYLELPQKPFQCNLCVGFWISLFPLLIQFGTIGILYAAMTGITSEALYRLINRL